jgi:hypothetical protein
MRAHFDDEYGAVCFVNAWMMRYAFPSGDGLVQHVVARIEDSNSPANAVHKPHVVAAVCATTW